jgi:hypothetical protein
MITVMVHEDSFVGAALQFVVKLIDTEEGLDLLLRQGCSANLLDDLRQRKARDLVEVAGRLRTMHILLSAKEIEGELHRLDRIREDQEMYEYFILNGASRNMICEMWKRTHDEVASMRKALLPGGGAAPGRSPMPKDTSVRESIHQAWAVIRKQEPKGSRRQHLYRLHQQFQTYTIDTLVCVLDEFKESSRQRSRRPSARSNASRSVSDEPESVPGDEGGDASDDE